MPLLMVLPERQGAPRGKLEGLSRKCTFPSAGTWQVVAASVPQPRAALPSILKIFLGLPMVAGQRHTRGCGEELCLSNHSVALYKRTWHGTYAFVFNRIIVNIIHSTSDYHPKVLRFLNVAFDGSGDSLIAGDHQGNIYVFDLNGNRWADTGDTYLINKSLTYLVHAIDYSFRNSKLNYNSLSLQNIKSAEKKRKG